MRRCKRPDSVHLPFIFRILCDVVCPNLPRAPVKERKEWEGVLRPIYLSYRVQRPRVRRLPVPRLGKAFENIDWAAGCVNCNGKSEEEWRPLAFTTASGELKGDETEPSQWGKN